MTSNLFDRLRQLGENQECVICAEYDTGGNHAVVPIRLYEALFAVAEAAKDYRDPEIDDQEPLDVWETARDLGLLLDEALAALEQAVKEQP